MNITDAVKRARAYERADAAQRAQLAWEFGAERAVLQLCNEASEAAAYDYVLRHLADALINDDSGARSVAKACLTSWWPEIAASIAHCGSLLGLPSQGHAGKLQ